MKPDTQRIIMYIGVTIGILGGGVGLAFAIAASPVFGILMALIFIFVFGGTFGSLFLRSRKRKRLLQSGIQANAEIIEIWDTGVTINNQPQIGIKLRVTPMTGMPYVAETKMIISRLQTSYYQAGVSCLVRYDPNDLSSVAIESIGGGAGNMQQSEGNSGMAPAGTFFAGKSPAEVEKWLTEIDAQNRRIVQTGIECKAIILKTEWMGAYVNGSNPATAFDVEVVPDNEPAYNAKCFGVVMQSSVPKYQPGKQIWIKYDPNNKNNITISHS